MSKTSSKSELSLEEEKQAWQRHHIESLLESASLPFSRKIQMLEEMEEVARAVAAATSLRRPTNTKSERRSSPESACLRKPSEFRVEFSSARSRSRGIDIIHARRIPIAQGPNRVIAPARGRILLANYIPTLLEMRSALRKPSSTRSGVA